MGSVLDNVHMSDTVDILRYLKSTKAHDQEMEGGNYASHRVRYDCPSHTFHTSAIFCVKWLRGVSGSN